MPAPYFGGCLCGATRYRVAAEPVTVYACHCKDCQRRTGSAFGLSVVVPRNAIEITSGEPSSYHAELTEGRVKRGVQCGECGARLWGELQKQPGMVVLQAGTLDDTSWVHPAAHVWTRSSQSWFAFPPGVPVYRTSAEDFSQLVQHWRAALSKG